MVGSITGGQTGIGCSPGPCTDKVEPLQGPGGRLEAKAEPLKGLGMDIGMEGGISPGRRQEEPFGGRNPLEAGQVAAFIRQSSRLGLRNRYGVGQLRTRLGTRPETRPKLRNKLRLRNMNELRNRN